MRILKSIFVLFLTVFCFVVSESCFAVSLKKELTYNQYTLNDQYIYGKTNRSFQWDKIESILDQIENSLTQYTSYACLTNYKNRQGVAPLIKEYTMNEYHSEQDKAGVSRYQGIPLYALNDTLVALRYARDGSFTYIIKELPTFYLVEVASISGQWLIPKQYVNPITASEFNFVAVVDVTNQNICVLEKNGLSWYIRSMNPATTGKHHPPFQKETPVGIFLLQNKLPRMSYNKDGTNELGGYAPYANRFCAGAYIHGIPVNLPATKMIEYSSTLGTTPRSHMCVRNATSHAKFIYDTLPKEETLVLVID